MFRRLWHEAPASTGTVVGYGGCWLIAGEAHISTIAVHPDYRGKGLGELLLIGMLQRALNLGGEYSVLEVRVSNEPAQALYRKHEYVIVGRRTGYYRDNGEDAYLMEVRPLDEGYQQRLTERTLALRQRINFVDQFTG
jgi:ribosomal-protein-alanine N-acetyltransferase